MKKYITLIFIVTVVFTACKNEMQNEIQKEIEEVDSLISLVDEIEKSVLSVDTSRAFAAKKQVSMDIAMIESLEDTLDKETAFKLDDYYSGKKRLFRFASNYNGFIKEIDLAKEQLNNLKQDLNNGLIDKEKFKDYYASEQASVMSLSSQVNKSVGGLEEAMQKMELNREDILKVFEELKQKNAENVE